ncbi:MAG: hypothetical protein JO025_02295 [Verrucomicrobia bacterium]|nr:hypothetical protein [Verrucomicrobiota bacterium]
MSINPAAAGPDQQSDVVLPQDCATPLRLARSPFSEALPRIPTRDSRLRNPQDNSNEPDSGIDGTDFLKVPPCLGVGLYNHRSGIPLILDLPNATLYGTSK